MKNYWKQFAEWAIELKNDPFAWARLESTTLYTLVAIAAFLVTNTFLLRLWFGGIERLIPASTSNLAPDVVAQLNDLISRSSLILYLLVILGIAAISLLINNRTLSPIRQIVRAQKRFIADASHELRTPLAIIKTNSEIALMDGDHIDPKEARDTFVSTIEEVNRMSKIIENLLSLSYYDNPAGEIKFERVELSQHMVGVVQKLKSLAKKKSIELRIPEAAPGYIFGTPIAVEQVIINLVKNAVTYTPHGGWISISVSARNSLIRQRNYLELKVKDNGIGIDKKDLANVFNPFYKIKNAKERIEGESSGLGLTIVKKIVERHHGTIYLNSAIGKGTTVIITFPRYQPTS